MLLLLLPFRLVIFLLLFPPLLRMFTLLAPVPLSLSLCSVYLFYYIVHLLFPFLYYTTTPVISSSCEPPNRKKKKKQKQNSFTFQVVVVVYNFVCKPWRGWLGGYIRMIASSSKRATGMIVLPSRRRKNKSKGFSFVVMTL